MQVEYMCIDVVRSNSPTCTTMVFRRLVVLLCTSATPPFMPWSLYSHLLSCSYGCYGIACNCQSFMFYATIRATIICLIFSLQHFGDIFLEALRICRVGESSEEIGFICRHISASGDRTVIAH